MNKGDYYTVQLDRKLYLLEISDITDDFIWLFVRLPKTVKWPHKARAFKKGDTIFENTVWISKEEALKLMEESQ